VDRDEGPQLVLAFETGLPADGRDLGLLVQGQTPERDAVVDDWVRRAYRAGFRRPRCPAAGGSACRSRIRPCAGRSR
jgi:hypothetical protein